MSAPVSTPHHNWFYRTLVLPVLALLRMGASPRRLAWSIAIGLLVGLNPVLGTTTVLCLAVSAVFRLNIVAAQVANHAMFPLEVMLVVPFLRLGSRMFGTAAMPLSREALMEHARHAPVSLLRELWVWEWHAFVLWLLVAAIAAPTIAMALTPLLERAERRVKRHQYPVLP